MTGWLPGAQAAHIRAATLITACACLLALSLPSVRIQATLLLIGVALVGMPHGAFDHVIGERVLRPSLGRAWAPVFALVYFALAGLVWLGWIAAPQLTLALFLAASVAHFGLGDAGDGPVAVIARGGLPVLLPMSLHPAAVAPVLATLAGHDPAPFLLAARWLIFPWAACLAWWLARANRADRMEVAALLAAFAVLPPLLSFAIYFCVCHSIRHLLRLAAMFSQTDRRAAFRPILRIGAQAVLACAIGAPLLAWGGVEAAIAPLFRLLAALTLPHMVVTAYLEPMLAGPLIARDDATRQSTNQHPARRWIAAPRPR